MANLPPIGTGAETTLDGLCIRVEVSYGGWRYSIWRGGEFVAGHEPCWPENQTENLASIEAVERALGILRRTENAARIAAELNWQAHVV
jgi:hypothetical protein